VQRYAPTQYQKSTQGGESSVVYGGDSLFNMQKETLTDLAGLGVDRSLMRREAEWDKTIWARLCVGYVETVAFPLPHTNNSAPFQPKRGAVVLG